MSERRWLRASARGCERRSRPGPWGRRSAASCCSERATSPSPRRSAGPRPRTWWPLATRARRRRPGAGERRGASAGCGTAVGAEVVFSVDCTKLKEHFSPGKREFDRIYFNFPHCGRKAGVVKNRQLLAGFFLSCAEVLAQEGQIHVALCNGQGGTPADQPRREWHNSWQIVAVAAGAGFILSDVHPFKAETVDGYKCTGYRSQDKSFCVEGALNHIFTRSTAPPCFTPVSCQTRLGSQKVSFQVPEVLVDKINRGFLEVSSSHPVRTVKEKLSAGLSQVFPLQNISSCLPLLHQGHPCGVCHSNIFWITLSPGEAPSTDKISQGLTNTLLCSHFGQDTDENAQEGCPVPKQFYLRPSLLPHAQAIIKKGAFSPGTLLVLSGPVFRKCRITPHSMPAFHEMLLVLAASRGTESSCVQMLVDNIKATVNSLHQGVSGVKPSISLQEATSFGTELSDFAAFERQLGEIQHFLCVGTDPDPSGSCVGVIRTAPDELKSQELVVVSASLNLDLLAMLLCGISDWRMLWTWDKRFLRQFPEGELRLFKSFSLYPPSYVHDVSFWLPDGEDFDEVAFHSLARRVSGEMVVSIQLRDNFQQPGTGRRSLCYRVTFQSCDRALGCREAAEMQLHFREEIQQHLGVTLR
ncbi:ferredoxin-fold anticodon-binding domain-containing protein 1 isoform X2 [Onychostruthus taczanowskii]|uniref:ferredoxin-fold anticodon-binding domain-containing protein 1 isoform X2 n=1 Tax=Onychostruthus taczanowskii TaxID=356909 RepID=UPI001B80A420|nr:ferredoxin-fold anticodon-binding domain-containing protein 1 isoform X2 [Onychostruthus taczanowskii]